MLKQYCQKHNVSMLEAINGLITLIVANDVEPKHYINRKGTQDIFSMRNEIFNELDIIKLEVKKTRDTFVFFQRTYEKQYRKDLALVKEATFIATKKTIAVVLKGDQRIKIMSNTINLLLIVAMEQLLIGYTYDREIVIKMVREESLRLSKRSENKGIFMSNIEDSASAIFKTIKLEKE